MKTHSLTIDMALKCSRCGKSGATGSGLCMTCICADIRSGKYDHLKVRKPGVLDQLTTLAGGSTTEERNEKP